jgi:hypothetical protein
MNRRLCCLFFLCLEIFKVTGNLKTAIYFISMKRQLFFCITDQKNN